MDQEAVPVAPEDTAYTLYRKLEGAARRLLDRALPALAAGTARAIPLDLARGSYFGGRKPADGRIDWSLPAAAIYNLIRAVTHPYPGAFTSWDGGTLYVWWALRLTDGRRRRPARSSRWIATASRWRRARARCA